MNTPSPQPGDELAARVESITAALGTAGDRIPPEVGARARADLDRVTGRLALGVHHTVVALVGGTGSGKSSMFNALSQLDFADVGVIRPTTSQAAACTWGGSAEDLLDFLGVDEARRIGRESALTGLDEEELAGLVLLDLPDHDSIAEGHAGLVDRLLPMIDLLIWVLDPQKYADNVLHEKYLRELTHRHEAMVVVVNQVDTVPESGLDHIRADVRRLLEADRLSDVAIILASAKTGHGVGMVRAELARVIAAESIAARTMRAELDAICERVGGELAPATPALPAADDTAAQLAGASGIPAVADSVRLAVAGVGPSASSRVQPPASSRIEAVREGWLDRVGGALPARWRDALVAAVAGPDGFYSRVSETVTAVPLPPVNDVRARRVRIGGLVLVALGVLAGLVAGFATGAWAWAGIGGGAAVVAGLVCVLVARGMRSRTAKARSGAYLARVHGELARVVAEELDEPARGILADHESVLDATMR
ncbi:ATP-binding protein [Pseudactinotalea sp. HY160]|uniref:GTP-binding protein n=1 Tax=Pseudactinotalea sp. HY160 TaxID=2654490 RepID=UPI00128DF5BE|nr:ATP-binding protein [Pseudactinotalea sp. HY160]